MITSLPIDPDPAIEQSSRKGLHDDKAKQTPKSKLCSPATTELFHSDHLLERITPPPLRPSPTQATVSKALPRQRGPSIRPATRPCQQCARGHSTSGTTSALKPAIHNNPFVAHRCRALRCQMAHLKHKIDDLSAVIEERQPEHSAMDWASSAATVIYVPVRVNQENEARPELRQRIQTSRAQKDRPFRKRRRTSISGRLTTPSASVFRGSGGAVPAKQIPARPQNLGTNIWARRGYTTGTQPRASRSGLDESISAPTFLRQSQCAASALDRHKTPILCPTPTRSVNDMPTLKMTGWKNQVGV